MNTNSHKIEKSTLATAIGRLLLLGWCFFSWSCGKELDLYPQNEFANDAFWTNETNAMVALTGAYAGAINFEGTQTQPTDWWGYYGLVMLEFISDNAYDRRGDAATYNQITNGELLPNNGYILQYWRGSYKRIAICNNFLENIGNVSMDEARKARMIAEVRFIRACQYFYLSQYWGSVPLVTTTLTPDEANNVVKESKSAIVDFVVNELGASVTDLPRYADLTVAEHGRASKQAALAFLGRILLAEKRYDEAAEVYDEIMAYGDNAIDPSYQSVFLEGNEFSTENIFSVKYIGGVAPNSIMQYAYPASLGGFHLVNPLGSLAESYEFTDGTPFSYDDPRFDANNMSNDRDPRFRYTFMWNGSTVQNRRYISHPDSTSSPDRVTYSIQATRTGYGCRKFCDESFTGLLRTDYGGDMPIIRYAEVLLSYLEAKLEGGEAIDQGLLDRTINLVRGRASVNMPSVTETNPDLLRTILRRERRVELAMEGLRYWDLLRWGIAGNVLKGDFWGAPFPDSQRYPDVSRKVDPLGLQRWYVTSKNYRSGQDEIWPIPESESNVNPNLLN